MHWAGGGRSVGVRGRPREDVPGTCALSQTRVGIGGIVISAWSVQPMTSRVPPAYLRDVEVA